MRISKIAVRNFRLLENVEIYLDDPTTLIVGRNNSGKTTLTELFRRLLDQKAPHFRLEDFSLGVCDQFWQAFQKKVADKEVKEIRQTLPEIKVELTVDYKDNPDETGALSRFIIDLDVACTEARVDITYALGDGKTDDLFEDVAPDCEKRVLFKALKERVPKLYEARLQAVDPNDQTNKKSLEFSDLRSLLQFNFISAQRSLDDTEQSGKAVIGRILETLFTAADSENANPADSDLAEQLRTAVNETQGKLDKSFNDHLTRLLPTFDLFGYRGLTDPRLRTETELKVERLLQDHTKVGYQGVEGVNLPESYNGLGPRNLIFILLKLYEFFKEFTAQRPAAGVFLVFIEEPEAHLHPQMQTVFIRRITEIAGLFAKHYNNGVLWPVQFIVTTHSSHIANEAKFDSMRYFLAQPREKTPDILATQVKDLRTGLSMELKENLEFLHKYMTLTRCDLLFADYAILIEGTTERLLLPKMIEKTDVQSGTNISSQYLTIMEVDGAYAHKFFNLLKFLNLKTLIVTDLDTVGDNGMKCKVSVGTHSSNACINEWFAGDVDSGKKGRSVRATKDDLLKKCENEKVRENLRLAYQIPHSNGDACGRSFEDAFMLANPQLFSLTDSTPDARESAAFSKAESIAKTSFALEHAILVTDWVNPRYIEEGLRWLGAVQTEALVVPDKHEKSAEMARQREAMKILRDGVSA